MAIDEAWIAGRLAILIPLLLSLSVHEWAHAWAAFRLGDDTAARQGRMTLNPIAHVDPVGTLLLPLIGVPFGWARPVPIEPLRFRRDVSMRAGIAIAALAGPCSNLVLAALAGAGLAVFGAADPGVHRLLSTMLLLNLLLAVFNLLPIPPLDGSRVVDALVPDGLRSAWSAFSRLGPVLLFALCAVGVVLRA